MNFISVNFSALLMCAICLVPRFSFAKEKLPLQVCTSITSISAKMQRGCIDNQSFIIAAERCLNRIEAASKMAELTVKKDFTKDQTAKQNSKFTHAAHDYNATLAKLDYLLALNTKAKLEVASYLVNIATPEDMDEPRYNGGNPERFARMYPCYGETQDTLNDILLDFDYFSDNFHRAKSDAERMAKISDQEKSALDSAPYVSPIWNAPAIKNNNQMPSQRIRLQDSSISGTEEIEK